jgi:hypothetical protein
MNEPYITVIKLSLALRIYERTYENYIFTFPTLRNKHNEPKYATHNCTQIDTFTNC